MSEEFYSHQPYNLIATDMRMGIVAGISKYIWSDSWAEVPLGTVEEGSEPTIN